MFKRAFHTLLVTWLYLLVGALTWGLSWFVQWLCAITIAGQHLDITSKPTNRLALITVLVAAAVALILQVMDEFTVALFGVLAVVIVFCWAGDWIIGNTFAGTPVAATAVQVLYGLATIMWGVRVHEIFGS